MTQTYNTCNCAETHLGGGVMSPLVSPLSAIDQAHNPTLIGNVALRTGPRRFCPHRSDRCRALMLTCRNSPLWQHCEHCNNVFSSFWLNSVVITWRVLIGTNRKLAACNYTNSLALWTTVECELVDANGVCQGIQKIRVEPATWSAVATCNVI